MAAIGPEVTSARPGECAHGLPGTADERHRSTPPTRNLSIRALTPSGNRVLEVFGDEAQARSWMDTPRDIFGGRSPQDLVTTGDPAEQRRVLEVLIRIELRRSLVVLPMKIYGMHRAARAPGDYKGAIFGKAGRRPLESHRNAHAVRGAAPLACVHRGPGPSRQEPVAAGLCLVEDRPARNPIVFGIREPQRYRILPGSRPCMAECRQSTSHPSPLGYHSRGVQCPVEPSARGV